VGDHRHRARERPAGISLLPDPPQDELDPFAPGNEHLTPPAILTYYDESASPRRGPCA